MATITVQVPAELKAELQIIARRECRSLASLVRLELNRLYMDHLDDLDARFAHK